MIQFRRTDSKDGDFIELVRWLDADLAELEALQVDDDDGVGGIAGQARNPGRHQQQEEQAGREELSFLNHMNDWLNDYT